LTTRVTPSVLLAISSARAFASFDATVAVSVTTWSVVSTSIAVSSNSFSPEKPAFRFREARLRLLSRDVDLRLINLRVHLDPVVDTGEAAHRGESPDPRLLGRGADRARQCDDALVHVHVDVTRRKTGARLQIRRDPRLERSVIDVHGARRGGLLRRGRLESLAGDQENADNTRVMTLFKRLIRSRVLLRPDFARAALTEPATSSRTAAVTIS
jgi:hypothetical protein